MACRDGCEPDWDDMTDFEVAVEGDIIHLWSTCVDCGEKIYTSTYWNEDSDWLVAEGGPEDFE